MIHMWWQTSRSQTPSFFLLSLSLLRNFTPIQDITIIYPSIYFSSPQNLLSSTEVKQEWKKCKPFHDPHLLNHQVGQSPPALPPQNHLPKCFISVPMNLVIQESICRHTKRHQTRIFKESHGRQRKTENYSRKPMKEIKFTNTCLVNTNRQIPDLNKNKYFSWYMEKQCHRTDLLL